jgi:hydroxymethylpyrimidine pyrophosphatase-like HAD family hydrolase/dTDP-4-dehydrorhamnose 3,5-epimerase-like enzyme
MIPRLVVSDVDGCITDGKGKAVDAALLSMLRTVIRDHGIRLILCSGRVHPYLEAVAQQIGLETTRDPLIVQSGAAFYYQCEDRMEPLLSDRQREAVTEANRRLKARAKLDSGWHLEAGRDLTACAVPDPGGITIPDLTQIVNEELGDLEIETHPSDGGVDVVAAGVNKGFALRIALERLGIAAEEVLGIGDTGGDLSFLSMVGMTGCPANAVKAVRRLVLSKQGHSSSFETTEGVIDILRYYCAGGNQAARATIFGVSLRHPKSISDERGRLIQWLDGTDALSYVSFYEIETLPGYVRGNHYHPAGTREELIRVTRGQFTVYLDDLRVDSPTHGVRQQIVLRASEPHMLRVPSGVAHALVNTGREVASASIHSTEHHQPGHDFDHIVVPAKGYRPEGNA